MLECDGAVLQKNLLRPTQDGCLSSLVQVRGALGQERTVLTESFESADACIHRQGGESASNPPYPLHHTPS